MKTSTKTGTMFSSRPIGRAGIAVLAMAIVFGMAAGFAACPNQPDDSPKKTTNPFVGKWTGVDSEGDEMTMTFTANTYEMIWPDLEGEDTKGTYTYSRNKAVLKDEDGSEGVAGVSEGVAGVSEDTLVFNFGGWPLTGTLTRPSSKPSGPSVPSVPEAKANLRYEIVPAGMVGQTRQTARSVSESDRFVLVDSAYDNDNYYYLYYLGYVSSVPVLYKDSFRYEGIGVQTISYEKSWSTEESVMQSLTKAKDETFEHNWNVGLSFEYGHKFGISSLAESSIKLGIQASYGQTIGSTISTSNTWETSRAKVEGETQSLSVVLDKSDPMGTYRYVLFGTLDVFCFFIVDKTTRLQKGDAQITQCARENAFTWGLDFEPLGSSNALFGRTGSGAPFSAPAIDFSTLPVPTKQYVEDEPIVPPTPELKTTWSITKTDKPNVVPPDDPNYSNLVSALNFLFGVVDPDGIIWAEGNDWRESYTITGFEKQKLLDAGFTTLQFKLTFLAKEVTDCWVNVYVDDERGAGYNLWASSGTIDLTPNNWNTIEKEFTVPITRMTPTLSVYWTAGSKKYDPAYLLDARTIAITAKQ
jgi:hypothetical protein